MGSGGMRVPCGQTDMTENIILPHYFTGSNDAIGDSNHVPTDKDFEFFIFISSNQICCSRDDIYSFSFPYLLLQMKNIDQANLYCQLIDISIPFHTY